MAVLLDLLSPYPVLEKLASFLSLGDLFNLSKLNSAYRCALHGFEGSHVEEDKPKGDGHVRPALLIGAHRTRFWENLKARSQLQCSEPHHKRGSNPQGCLICSMPVCEACIIKASFAKRNENTFQNRHRSLCPDCWYSGNKHKKQPVQVVSNPSPKPYPDQATDGEFCNCTAKSGHICLKCKTEQNAERLNEAERCYGQGCLYGYSKSRATPMEGRVCLWCSRQLPGSRSRAESRRDYDARHILARSHSSYDRHPEEEDLDSFEEQRMLELDALSRRKEELRQEAFYAASLNEGEGLVDLKAHAREQERWQRLGAGRPEEWPLLPPSTRGTSDLPRYEDHNDEGVATDGDDDMAIIAANHAMSSTKE